MTAHAWLTLGVFLLLLVALAYPLGEYIARVAEGRALFAARLVSPFERLVYRLGGIDPAHESNWKEYAASVLVFNLLGALAVYGLQRAQALLPLNPSALPAVEPGLSFNTAVSFATNTNWQSYSGETTLGYAVQMLGLTTQNFLSAATGMAVLLAFVRGFSRQRTTTLGSFWVDLVRCTLYVLLPLATLVALLLVAQGVVQTLAGPVSSTVLDPSSGEASQAIARGPAAAQIAIKQLGTNGGGFFNVNSAHPFENPTPLSNLLELLSIVLVPAALCFTFGRMVNDRRQGLAIFGAMALIFVPLAIATITAEQAGNPALAALGIDDVSSALQSGGNMEGKEVRFGIVDSALWAATTTAASNGSVNAMHDSFMPLGGLVPMWLMQLGEIVFGGVGSGLYGMLAYALVAVFLAGLMVGRTPEYLGKKIEAYEMKMASLVILLPAATVLLGTAIACLLPSATAAVGNPGPHGFSEILYAFSSAANDNGSAFGGLTATSPFYLTALGLAMLVGRFWLVVPVLALAGAVAKKQRIPTSLGTLSTHGPLFVALLVGTVLLVGALTFVPALALGPVAETLTEVP